MIFIFAKNSANKRRAIDFTYYWRIQTFLIVLWAIPVCMNIAGLTLNQIQFVVALNGLIILIINSLRSEYILIGLPYLALLSPVGGFFTFSGMRFVLMDFMMGPFLIQALLLVFKRGKRTQRLFSRRTETLFILLAFIYTLSFLISMLRGYLMGLEPLYYLLCFCILYILFVYTATSVTNWKAIIWSITMAGALGSILIINSYFSGTLLLNFSLKEADLVFQHTELNYLFRAAYYYAGFHFVLGILITGFVLKMLTSKQSLVARLFFSILLMFFILSLLLMLNRTAIYSSVIAVIISLCPLVLRLRKISNFAVLAVFAIIFPYFISSAVTFLQEDTLNNRFSILDYVQSSSSFMVRLQVWKNALSIFFTDTLAWLVGVGPNVFEKGLKSVRYAYLVSMLTGNRENALDSTWLTLMVELGIFFMMIFVYIVFSTLVKLFQLIQRNKSLLDQEPEIIMVLGGLTYTVIAFATQSLGYAKISWFFFLYLLLGLSYISRFRKVPIPPFR